MDTNDTKTAADRAQAEGCLTSIFCEVLASCGESLEDAEDLCLAAGHEILAKAFGRALERLDAKICAELPKGTRIHDKRQRTMATKMGDVTFRYRRCRDEYGNTVVPLADALDFPWNARISPAARVFLVTAGADVSFVRSARLLESAGGSSVSPASVMRCVHRAGELCAAEDEAAAIALVRDGVIPDADCEVAEICVESDGTFFKLQGFEEADSVEVKALVAYAGKYEEGGKTFRVKPVRHGCVAAPADFWCQSTAALGTRFDLSKLEVAHMGSDGEAQYLGGHLACKCVELKSVDPFHVNRKVYSSFKQEFKNIADNVLGMVIDGYAMEAADVIEVAGALKMTTSKAAEAAAYLRNNAEYIYRLGAESLGTMEAEQQHVYGARMDAVPCGWSIAGADAMARIRSRAASKREVPRYTRETSVTPHRKKMVENRTMASLAKKVDTKVPLRVGKGRGAEHVASVAGMSADVRYAAGLDNGMVATAW